MPSAQRSRALPVLLLLLSATALHVTGAPCSSPGGDTLEISGDELPDALKTSASTKWKPLTYLLICEVNSLCDQFVEEFGVPKDSVSDFKPDQLELPRDCSSPNFSKENYLLRISRGLERHMVYLQFVERECSKPGKVSHIRLRTKALADHVMELMNNSKRAQGLNSEVRDQLLSNLNAATAWQKKITVPVLLRDYRTFLENTLRALRCIEDRARKKNGPNA
ncbi:interleukin-6-like [Anguilla anguilla]|uniref:interleukin-6-like n=1 Tax=Anguilla anguilla TaxID=7936 RepID=UPI0015AEB764|nr:interleukin-6-like [Anguilla anguilla]